MPQVMASGAQPMRLVIMRTPSSNSTTAMTKGMSSRKGEGALLCTTVKV